MPTAGLVTSPSVLLVDDLLHVADHQTPVDVVAVKLRLQDRVHAGASHDVHAPLGLGVTPEVIKLRYRHQVWSDHLYEFTFDVSCRFSRNSV